MGALEKYLKRELPTMPTKDIDVEEEQVEITKTPAKRRKQVFQRAVKRNYQRHDVGQKTR